MLEDLYIKNTDKTPKVIFQTIGILSIVGRSFPEDTAHFYNPILQWVDIYLKKPFKKTEMIIRVDYCNTSSIMYLHSILRKFDIFFKKGNHFRLDWHYEREGNEIVDISAEYNLDAFSFPVEFLEF